MFILSWAVFKPVQISCNSNEAAVFSMQIPAPHPNCCCLTAVAVAAAISSSSSYMQDPHIKVACSSWTFTSPMTTHSSLPRCAGRVPYTNVTCPFLRLSCMDDLCVLRTALVVVVVLIRLCVKAQQQKCFCE